MSFLKTTAIQHLNASTPAINLDANGNIGIGTTSPNKDPGVTRAVTLNGTTNIVEFCVSDSRVGWVYSDNSLLAVSAGGARTCRLETNGYPRLSIDSNGYVTKPYTPRFDVYKSDNQSFSGLNTTTVAFNSVVNDTTNSFNTSTSRFTAPITGVYHFRWSGMMMGLSSVSFISLNLYINGGDAEENMLAGWKADFNTMCFSAFRPMSAGDTAEIKIYHNGVNSGAYIRAGAAMNRFQGYLLG